MAQQRLPYVDGDDGDWGDILNQYLTKEHVDTGVDNAGNGGHKTITIVAGTAASGTAPLKIASGTNMSSPEAGAIEYNGDFSITRTGNARSVVVAETFSQTLTNKTINLSSNTLTGTTAQFNTALSDNDFATLAGAENLTNKTLTTPRIDAIRDTAGNTITSFSGGGTANYVTVSNANASSSPSIAATGSDTNISLVFQPKGSGNAIYISQPSGNDTAIINAQGVGTNINLNITTKGTGAVQINGVTVATISDIQTFSSKNINLSSNTLTGTTAQFNTALSDNDFATLAGLETLTTKTINLANNTLTGTTAQFNTALSDNDFTTIAGIETLTNKTLTTPTVNNPTVNNYVEGVVAAGTVTTTHTFNLTNGTLYTATLTASTACTFTMPTATAGKSFTLLLKQAAVTGNGSATFTGVKWAAAGAPTITVTAGKMDILTFVSDGASWYGSFVQGYTP